MQIKNVVTRPYEKSIPPGLSFEIEITHIKFQEAIVSVNGWLESDDGKMLTKLVEVTPEKPRSKELGAKGSSEDSKFAEIVYNAVLIAPLDGKALDYVEKRRIEDVKRDVYLNLNLNVKSIESRAVVCHLHEVNPKTIRMPPIKVIRRHGRETEGNLIVYAYDSGFHPGTGNRWVISGDSSPTFLSIKEQSLREERVRIPSVDWIHDYAPKLELGEYFIVEIPKGKMTIKEAWEYVEKAEECYRQWDTKGAYANCREVGKLLSEVIKKRFRKSPIIKKWKRAIEKFEKLTSLDLHEEDIKEEVPKGEISISKAETEHILIVTKALIKYAEELLQEKRKE